MPEGYSLYSFCRYTTFGTVNQNRSFSSQSYRYGFNGKEKDDEMKGGGNSQDYGLRIYDSRLGRFLSVDPLTKDYPWYTPYSFAGNKPIAFIDLDGGEDAKFDAMDRNTRKAANILYPKDQARQDRYIMDAARDRAVGAALGAVVIFAEYSPVLARLGLMGALVSSGISIAKGDDAYTVVKSAYSGFYGAAALGFGGTATTLLGLAGKGAISGIVGDATSQVFDNAFGNSDGYDLGEMAKSGAIGAIANVFSSKLVDAVSAKISKIVSKALEQTETEAYKSTIQKAIQTEAPRIGNQELKNAVNARISEIQGLIKKQGEQLKAGLKQAIEKGTDVLQDKANETGK